MSVPAVMSQHDPGRSPAAAIVSRRLRRFQTQAALMNAYVAKSDTDTRWALCTGRGVSRGPPPALIEVHHIGVTGITGVTCPIGVIGVMGDVGAIGFVGIPRRCCFFVDLAASSGHGRPVLLASGKGGWKVGAPTSGGRGVMVLMAGADGHCGSPCSGRSRCGGAGSGWMLVHHSSERCLPCCCFGAGESRRWPN